MTRAWGLDRDEFGNGTTPEDVQRIWAAMYTNAGIIDGCDTTGTATMEYAISAGAVLIDTGPDMAVIAAVPATTIPTIPSPTTGSRTDTIYVNLDSQVLVTQGNLPANSVLLGRFTVASGTTATSAATRIGTRRFAVPVGGSLGRLHHYNGAVGTGPAPIDRRTYGAGTFSVPTNRDVEIRLQSTLVAVTDTGAIDPNGWGSVFYRFWVDGELKVSFERRYDRVAETKEFSHYVWVPEGTHTIHYSVERQFVGGGAGRWRAVKGGSEKHLGDEFAVFDRGVTR